VQQELGGANILVNGGRLGCSVLYCRRDSPIVVAAVSSEEGDMADRSDTPEFLIQITPEWPGGPRLQADRQDVIRGTKEQLDAAASIARAAGVSMRDVFEEIAPSSGSVEFSLSFEGEAGIPMIAKGKATATFAITLEWKRAAS
jgi:hypothetical protein